jgi:uncharacterized protein YdaU (DUF1376 family)
MPDDSLPACAILTQKLFGSSRFASMGGFAQGIYVLLLLREHGFRGRGLPEHMPELMRLCNLRPDEWEMVRTDVLQFFVARAGRLFNDTLEEQLAIALARKAQARMAAQHRWSVPDGAEPSSEADARLTEGKEHMRTHVLGHMRTQMPSVQVQDDLEPPSPPESPDGDSGLRPSACGGRFLEAAKALGMKPREAGRLLKAHPELTAEDLDRWSALPRTRPELVEHVDQVPAYLRSLVFRYGTVDRADLKPPKRKPDGAATEARREEALARRTAEQKAESAKAKAEATPPPTELIAKARRRSRT